MDIEGAFMDNSQLYSVDHKINKMLRTFTDGKLHLDSNGLLPIGQHGIEVSGEQKFDWWMG